jgi:hypothetical protein
LSYTSPQKGKHFFCIYEVFTLDFSLNGALFTTHLATKIDAVQILPMDQTAGFEGRKISDVEKPYCMLQPTGDVVRNAYTTGHYTHVNGTREGGDQGC